MTTEAVRQAASQPDMNHREPAYLDLIREVKDGLSRLSGGMKPYVMGGSGTSAMEAMAASCIKRGPVLILADGYYSDRMDAIFKVHGIEHVRVDFDWLEGWDLDRAAEALNAREWEAVVMTHHETTTGRLNPVEPIARLAREKGIKVMVDAMSSLGADPLDFSTVDYVAASANKCLHGLPGVSFVLCREGAGFVSPPRTYALDLAKFESDVPAMTAPVPMLAAFRQALREFWARGGESGRRAEYSAKCDAIRSGLVQKGYRLPIPEDRRSCTLTLSTLPKGSTYEGFFEHCLSRGYVIYRSKGRLADDYFQVSSMGEVSLEQVMDWLDIVPSCS